MKRTGFVSLILAMFAITGLNPLSPFRDVNGVLDEQYEFENEVRRQSNGVYRVQAFTNMPETRAEMVRWWFADYMQTTEHYQRWHPAAHVWMDWENKEPGAIIGASHLVHEYLGEDLHKLRIQFVDPSEVLGDFEPRVGEFIICARAGALEEPMNFTSMCHIVRDVDGGAQMRSVFWMGHVAKRNGNDIVRSVLGFLGNTWLMRKLLISERFANDLMIHAQEEMSILASFLPALYETETAQFAK